MTRSKLVKLEHDLHAEPRRHDWAPWQYTTTNPTVLDQTRHCQRPNCYWIQWWGQQEPYGCTGEDAE